MSRARANDEAPMVDAHVERIADLMADGAWGPVAEASMAMNAGVARGTVRKWAAMAGRLLRLTMDESKTEERRARNLATLDAVVAAAFQAGDFKATVSAVAEQNRLLGLVVQKHEVQAMTAEEADRLIAEAKKL